MNTKISLNTAYQNFRYCIPVQQFIPPWDRSCPVEVSVSLSKGCRLSQDFGSHQLMTREVSRSASHLRPVEIEIPSPSRDHSACPQDPNEARKWERGLCLSSGAGGTEDKQATMQAALLLALRYGGPWLNSLSLNWHTTYFFLISF